MADEVVEADERQVWFAEQLIPAGVAFWKRMQEKQQAHALTEDDVYAMMHVSQPEAIKAGEAVVKERIRVLDEIAEQERLKQEAENQKGAEPA